MERGRIVLNTEVPLTFVKSGYLMEGYILTIQYVDLDNVFIIEPVEYERRVKRAFATDMFGSSCPKKNNIVLFSGGERRAVASGLRRY